MPEFDYLSRDFEVQLVTCYIIGSKCMPKSLPIILSIYDHWKMHMYINVYKYIYDTIIETPKYTFTQKDDFLVFFCNFILNLVLNPQFPMNPIRIVGSYFVQ